MDRNNQDIEGFDYPDLDLSDQQPVKPKKQSDEPSGDPTKKIKTNESIQRTNQVQNKSNKNQKESHNPSQPFRNPLPFFPPPPGVPSKGTNLWVPPPPVVQRTSQSNYNYQQRPQFQKPQYIQNRDNRDKKNTVYVKNIPKSFNTPQKLMTFFKNEGAIKQIKVNQAEQSAVIRFVKQENTAKFLKSNKIIFNRSYIIYGQNENLHVSQQQINDRINDEMGNVKKAEQTNMKVLKQKLSNQLAENIRGLYFLENNIVVDGSEDATNLKKNILSTIESKVQAKKFLDSQNTEQFKPEDYQTNDFDWSLSFNRKTDSLIDRKSLFAEFLKYGPLSSIDFQMISQKVPKNQDQKNQNQQTIKAEYEFKIKVVFLGLKHAWEIYCSKKEEMGIQVQGSQIRRYFDSGKLKIPELKKIHQTDSGSQNLANQQKVQATPAQNPQNLNGQSNHNIEETQGLEVPKE